MRQTKTGILLATWVRLMPTPEAVKRYLKQFCRQTRG